ncbi:hypothetical protein JCM16303_000658 [Sporobolomyces ruberrimus]
MEEMEAGTELTIAYIELRQTEERRKAALFHTFGFVCTCSACSIDPEAIKKSDARRVAIKEIQDMISALAPRIVDPLKLVQDAKSAFALVEAEGIHGTRVDLASECLGICSLWGDVRNAHLWLDKVLELEGCSSGIWCFKY